MTAWLSRALCKGKPSDFWFPPVESPHISQYYLVGKLMCDRCPVWEDCLDYGKDELYGMWGGLIPRERPIEGTAPMSLGIHGSITRYRQGCNCTQCADAAFTPMKPCSPDLLPDHKDAPIDIQETVKSLSEMFETGK